MSLSFEALGEFGGEAPFAYIFRVSGDVQAELYISEPSATTPAEWRALCRAVREGGSSQEGGEKTGIRADRTKVVFSLAAEGAGGRELCVQLPRSACLAAFAALEAALAAQESRAVPWGGLPGSPLVGICARAGAGYRAVLSRVCKAWRAALVCVAKATPLSLAAAGELTLLAWVFDEYPTSAAATAGALSLVAAAWGRTEAMLLCWRRAGDTGGSLMRTRCGRMWLVLSCHECGAVQVRRTQHLAAGPEAPSSAPASCGRVCDEWVACATIWRCLPHTVNLAVRTIHCFRSQRVWPDFLGAWLTGAETNTTRGGLYTEGHAAISARWPRRDSMGAAAVECRWGCELSDQQKKAIRRVVNDFRWEHWWSSEARVQ